LVAAFITPLRGNILNLPIVGPEDLVVVIPWLLGAGVVVALIASFVGMRRFLDI
jgi:cell division protein FtsX